MKLTVLAIAILLLLETGGRGASIRVIAELPAEVASSDVTARFQVDKTQMTDCKSYETMSRM